MTSVHSWSIEKLLRSLRAQVRGEGGVLLNGAGERFMQQYDERLELAPRDVVARSIDHQCKLRGEECAFLDVSHLPRQALLTHFPNIARECLAHGIDITSQPIPVTPAMHYTCGGVHVGASAQTSLPGLFACGEAACTGLHGANRLASNSLLEVRARRKPAFVANVIRPTDARPRAIPGPLLRDQGPSPMLMVEDKQDR